ncbi:hypothetical protein Tco_0729979 [Tanacetum coccineum]|uniref:Uncharacterized protein n=1 Tax=Tanacetum coccineum TaxID=301880 RepID=A0ABQ4YQG9_9ASTR
MDISQESRALICTLLKESSEKDRELHLSMYGKAAQLQKQMDAKSAWFQEKYSGLIHGAARESCNQDPDSFLQCRMKKCQNSPTSRSSSLAVTSSGLSSNVSNAGLPSEKIMASGKNGDDGDLLLFRDGPGTWDIGAGALGLFIS